MEIYFSAIQKRKQPRRARTYREMFDTIKGEMIPTDALVTYSFPALEKPRRIPELIAGANGILKAMVEF